MPAATTVFIRRSLLGSVLVATLFASACASEDIPNSAEASIGGGADNTTGDDVDAGAPASAFIDARSYLQTAEEIDAWFALMAALRSDFDDVCGDTFCEGDYSNLESLRFRCSADETSGVLGSCVWIFGASNEEIDSADGAMTVDGRIFTCEMPLAADTDIHAFVQALTAPGVQAIHAPLPGTELSLYDGLIECL